MTESEKRQRLIEFLDDRAFLPILNQPADAYFGEADKRALEDAKSRTVHERRRYHNNYRSADEIRQRFLEDVRSPHAEHVNKELQRLNLPRLPDLRDEFLRLCEEIGVARGA